MTFHFRKARHERNTTTHRKSRGGTRIRRLYRHRLGRSKALLESPSGGAERPPTRDSGQHSGSRGSVDRGVADAFGRAAAGHGAGTAAGSLGGDVEQVRTRALVSGPPHNSRQIPRSLVPLAQQERSQRCGSAAGDSDHPSEPAATPGSGHGGDPTPAESRRKSAQAGGRAHGPQEPPHGSAEAVFSADLGMVFRCDLGGGGRSAGAVAELAGSTTGQAGKAGEVSARPPLLRHGGAPPPDSAGPSGHPRPRPAGFSSLPGGRLGTADGRTAGLHPATGKTHRRAGGPTTGLAHFPIPTGSRCGSGAPSDGGPGNTTRSLQLSQRAAMLLRDRTGQGSQRQNAVGAFPLGRSQVSAPELS